LHRVSTIIAVYNMASYIAEAVRSVQTQSVGELEIIVVDDGSTDETSAILKGIAGEDERIRVISQPNAGAAAARNTGLASATGDFITFLDGDDLYAPRKLERQLAVLSGYPEMGLVYHDLSRFSDDPASPAPPHLRQARFLDRIRDHFSLVESGLYLGRVDAYKILTIDYLGIATSSVMFRRDLLKPGEQPFQVDLRVAEDLDLWHRLIRRTRIGFLDEVLSLYRQHPASMMASLDQERFMRDDHLVRSRYLSELDHELSDEEWRRYGSMVSEAWFRLGYGTFLAGHTAEARQAYVRAFRSHPNIRPLVAYLKTLAPATAVRRWRALQER